MKNKILRHGVSFALTFTLAAVTGVAMAGSYTGYQVGINDTYKFAVGSIATTRNTPDSTQYIGCYHNAYTTGTSSGNCYAVSNTGVSRSCYTNNANLIETIRSIGDDSYIYFQWNTDGTCAYILVDKGSRFRP